MMLIVKRILSSLVCIVLATCSLKSQENKIEEYVSHLIQTNQLAGAAIAVVKDQKLVYDKNFGHADIENKIEVSNVTAFNIMSISKIFIACSILQLADKKIIDLDSPIKKYLNTLPDAYNQVLVRQLLNHTAGVPDYVHVQGYMAQANRNQTPWEVLTPVLNSPLDFNPGEKSDYSNSGYFLLGLLIEKVTGTGLDRYLEKNMFGPLGMHHTYLDSSVADNKMRAKGYASSNNQLIEVSRLDPSQYWAAGGIVSTKQDMLTWNEALSKGSILPLNEIQQMLQPPKLTNGNDGAYGLGFELMNTPDLKVAGNNGVGIGFNASNLQFLNDGLTILVLTNTTNGNSTMIAKTIRDILLNKPKEMVQNNEDKLDSLVVRVFTDVQKGVVNANYFNDSIAVSNFKKETYDFIKKQGNFINIAKKNEKINPQSIVRKYQINFEKGKANMVIIFSNDGKIIITNNM